MPSLDFVYDITEKLDEEKIDYLVLTIREHRVESKVDVFFNVSREGEEVLEKSLKEIVKIVKERDDTQPTKPKRKRRKKS